MVCNVTKAIRQQRLEVYIHIAYSWLVTVSLVGRRGHDRMVVWFTTTYAIGAYHHWCCGFQSRSGRGAQRYV